MAVFWIDEITELHHLIAFIGVELQQHTHTHTRLTALRPGLPGWASSRKVKPIWILLKQETVSGSGISWATRKSAPRSTDNHTSTPPHSFLQAGYPSCRPTNSVKALEAQSVNSLIIVTLYCISCVSCVTEDGATIYIENVLYRGLWFIDIPCYMQVCTLHQTDNNASTPPLSFYRLDSLPAAQPTVSKHKYLIYQSLARRIFYIYSQNF